MFLVVESTGHEHYRTGHIAAAVGNCYLIQFDKMEESEAPPLPPMELYTLEELSRTCEDCGQKSPPSVTAGDQSCQNQSSR